MYFENMHDKTEGNTWHIVVTGLHREMEIVICLNINAWQKLVSQPKQLTMEGFQAIQYKAQFKSQLKYTFSIECDVGTA